MARVSIVIPAFNAAPFIEATLNSVLQSTFRDFEVVVVNDGSSDRTEEIVAAYGPPVRLISQSNAGMSASRNIGIAASNSEFIALLDSDDIWHPEKLRLQVEALDRQPDVNFCYTGFETWFGEDCPNFSSEARSGTVDQSLSGWIYKHLILDNWTLPSSILFRRSAWDAQGPFLCENQQTDDWEYLVRASTSHRFIRLAESMVLYRQHQQSLSKRVPSVNSTELMRSTLIARHGTHEEKGGPIDLAALRTFQTRGWRNFADAHCASGNIWLGLGVFGKLLLSGPGRLETLQKLTKSSYRRIFPKSKFPNIAKP